MTTAKRRRKWCEAQESGPSARCSTDSDSRKKCPAFTVGQIRISPAGPEENGDTW
jgi:hypothetical protein